MDRLNKQKILSFLKNNKFVLLIIAIGVALLLLPSSSTKKEVQKSEAVETFSDDEYAANLEKKLEELDRKSVV